MSSNAIVYPGESNDKTRRSDTCHVQADQDSGFVAIGQRDDENRANDVGHEPGRANVSPVVWPSLQGERACPNSYNFDDTRYASEKSSLPGFVSLPCAISGKIRMTCTNTRRSNLPDS